MPLLTIDKSPFPGRPVPALIFCPPALTTVEFGQQLILGIFGICIFSLLKCPHNRIHMYIITQIGFRQRIIM